MILEITADANYVCTDCRQGAARLQLIVHAGDCPRRGPTSKGPQLPNDEFLVMAHMWTDYGDTYLRVPDLGIGLAWTDHYRIKITP